MIEFVRNNARWLLACISMILSKGEIITPNGNDAWFDLPGLAVLIGGMWVANLYYWGFNQYIIQRTLAAKSLEEGQKGIAFAAFLKLLIPIFVVLPGIIVYVMNLDASGALAVSSLDQGFIGENGAIINDNAAPWLIKEIIPVGLKGLILAALAAAIVSSLASMVNSTFLFTLIDVSTSIAGGRLSTTVIVISSTSESYSPSLTINENVYVVSSKPELKVITSDELLSNKIPSSDTHVNIVSSTSSGS